MPRLCHSQINIGVDLETRDRLRRMAAQRNFLDPNAKQSASGIALEILTEALQKMKAPGSKIEIKKLKEERNDECE